MLVGRKAKTSEIAALGSVVDGDPFEERLGALLIHDEGADTGVTQTTVNRLESELSKARDDAGMRLQYEARERELQDVPEEVRKLAEEYYAALAAFDLSDQSDLSQVKREIAQRLSPMISLEPGYRNVLQRVLGFDLENTMREIEQRDDEQTNALVRSLVAYALGRKAAMNSGQAVARLRARLATARQNLQETKRVRRAAALRARDAELSANLNESSPEDAKKVFWKGRGFLSEAEDAREIKEKEMNASEAAAAIRREISAAIRMALPVDPRTGAPLVDEDTVRIRDQAIEARLAEAVDEARATLTEPMLQRLQEDLKMDVVHRNVYKRVDYAEPPEEPDGQPVRLDLVSTGEGSDEFLVPSSTIARMIREMAYTKPSRWKIPSSTLFREAAAIRIARERLARRASSGGDVEDVVALTNVERFIWPGFRRFYNAGRPDVDETAKRVAAYQKASDAFARKLQAVRTNIEELDRETVTPLDEQIRKAETELDQLLGREAYDAGVFEELLRMQRYHVLKEGHTSQTLTEAENAELQQLDASMQMSAEEQAELQALAEKADNEPLSQAESERAGELTDKQMRAENSEFTEDDQRRLDAMWPSAEEHRFKVLNRLATTGQIDVTPPSYRSRWTQVETANQRGTWRPLKLGDGLRHWIGPYWNSVSEQEAHAIEQSGGEILTVDRSDKKLYYSWNPSAGDREPKTIVRAMTGAERKELRKLVEDRTAASLNRRKRMEDLSGLWELNELLKRKDAYERADNAGKAAIRQQLKEAVSKSKATYINVGSWGTPAEEAKLNKAYEDERIDTGSNPPRIPEFDEAAVVAEWTVLQLQETLQDLKNRRNPPHLPPDVSFADDLLTQQFDDAEGAGASASASASASSDAGSVQMRGPIYFDVDKHGEYRMKDKITGLPVRGPLLYKLDRYGLPVRDRDNNPVLLGTRKVRAADGSLIEEPARGWRQMFGTPDPDKDVKATTLDEGGAVNVRKLAWQQVGGMAGMERSGVSVEDPARRQAMDAFKAELKKYTDVLDPSRSSGIRAYHPDYGTSSPEQWAALGREAAALNSMQLAKSSVSNEPLGWNSQNSFRGPAVVFKEKIRRGDFGAFVQRSFERAEDALKEPPSSTRVLGGDGKGFSTQPPDDKRVPAKFFYKDGVKVYYPDPAATVNVMAETNKGARIDVDKIGYLKYQVEQAKKTEGVDGAEYEQELEKARKVYIDAGVLDIDARIEDAYEAFIGTQNMAALSSMRMARFIELQWRIRKLNEAKAVVDGLKGTGTPWEGLMQYGSAGEDGAIDRELEKAKGRVELLQRRLDRATLPRSALPIAPYDQMMLEQIWPQFDPRGPTSQNAFGGALRQGGVSIKRWNELLEAARGGATPAEVLALIRGNQFGANMRKAWTRMNPRGINQKDGTKIGGVEASEGGLVTYVPGAGAGGGGDDGGDDVVTNVITPRTEKFIMEFWPMFDEDGARAAVNKTERDAAAAAGVASHTPKAWSSFVAYANRMLRDLRLGPAKFVTNEQWQARYDFEPYTNAYKKLKSMVAETGDWAQGAPKQVELTQRRREKGLRVDPTDGAIPFSSVINGVEIHALKMKFEEDLALAEQVHRQAAQEQYSELYPGQVLPDDAPELQYDADAAPQTREGDVKRRAGRGARARGPNWGPLRRAIDAGFKARRRRRRASAAGSDWDDDEAPGPMETDPGADSGDEGASSPMAEDPGSDSDDEDVLQQATRSADGLETAPVEEEDGADDPNAMESDNPEGRRRPMGHENDPNPPDDVDNRMEWDEDGDEYSSDEAPESPGPGMAAGAAGAKPLGRGSAPGSGGDAVGLDDPRPLPAVPSVVDEVMGGLGLREMAAKQRSTRQRQSQPQPALTAKQRGKLPARRQ